MTHPAPLFVVKMRSNKSPKRVRFGYPWIFNDEIVLDRRTRGKKPGSIVNVQASDGEVLGLGALHPDSRIAVRMLERDTAQAIDIEWISGKIKQALLLREKLYDRPFYRLIHAEADSLPGVVADRFGDVISVQPNAAWAEEMFEDLATALQSVTGVSAIYKNAAGRARKLEGLEAESGLWCGQLDGPLAVEMNGATYFADLVDGQKTGLFFDQRENHAFAAKLGRDGRVLDVFSHVGGFGLAALAAGARSALALDGSAPALEYASRGAAAMDLSGRFSTRKTDAFAGMQALIDDAERFDLVVCDPPAFAPSKPALEAGLRAYEKTARLGAKLVEKGGFLTLCSCSHAATPDLFREASLRGIARAGRSAQLLHVGGAGPDHPEHPQLAESTYLKALFFRIN